MNLSPTCQSCHQQKNGLQIVIRPQRQYLTKSLFDFPFEKAPTKMFYAESEIFERQPKTWDSLLTKWSDHAKEILLIDQIGYLIMRYLI